ncbi:hypothetical protein GDO78_002117 [Eleutherodactylus coqui]|uniref:Uncharacterized protein n=1 Tax=Eleutherodactylus coqui TaxID=57060 RepID=A0A8J6FXD1_ELECQ|nr:hypothetical protein GDO78_002117 [Eleutherodactylus coqui]
MKGSDCKIGVCLESRIMEAYVCIGAVYTKRLNEIYIYNFFAKLPLFFFSRFFYFTLFKSRKKGCKSIHTL